ncbi:SWF or SNF family helicase [Streptomyces venezuelae]|uniref:SWF or SNF family helicase n=1 Tax=Streptomyces venezuelae TaxID=54571 RepID=A0A5P2DF55_STRVZ|nr:SWF or SNF family helicase [Streptomyces venezuelae]
MFPALPAASGRGFAQTWWGRTWLSALEDSALDGEQLRHGRRYARSGAVGAVSVRPGRLTAVVRDPDGTAHRTDVLVQSFTESEWDLVLGTAAGRAGHIAALLDREMPPELVEDAAAAGVDLLPGIGGLEPSCDCGEWDHCPHTAALCYQVARLLDRDPFVLLLMRGRAEREVLAELEERSAAEAEPTAGPGGGPGGGPVGEGVSAAAVFAAGDGLPPLPALPELPSAPGQPPPLDTESEPDLDVDAVEFLGQSAAGEAYRLLAEALAPGHADRPLPAGPPSVAEDAVRLAAETSDVRVRARLARVSGRDRAALELAVRAWRFGGAAALAVLEEDWAPDRPALARASAALAAAEADGAGPGEGAGLRRVRARWTLPGGEAQLRLGQEGRWWPYRKEAGRWLPAGPGGPDPETALAVLGPDPAAEPTTGQAPEPEHP